MKNHATVKYGANGTQSVGSGALKTSHTSPMQATGGAVSVKNRQAMVSPAMTLSVLIPTYRRPMDLRRCLSALDKLDRRADEVIVICRQDDRPTHDVIDTFRAALPLKVVTVTATGVVAALNAGLDVSTGDVVCMTDDDAAPHRDWLARIERHYRDRPDLAGVGGKDNVHGPFGVMVSPKTKVGLLSAFGRLIGNHHLGVGEARLVDVLKGVNMSYRGDLVRSIRFDSRLRGTGAQVHNEMALCLAIRRRGMALLYDPAIQVEHYPAQRFDEDGRNVENPLAITNASFNFFLIVLMHFSGWQRQLVWQWYRCIGTSTVPGWLQVALGALRGRDYIRTRWTYSRIAADDAWRAASKQTGTAARLRSAVPLEETPAQKPAETPAQKPAARWTDRPAIASTSASVSASKPVLPLSSGTGHWSRPPATAATLQKAKVSVPVSAAGVPHARIDARLETTRVE